MVLFILKYKYNDNDIAAEPVKIKTQLFLITASDFISDICHLLIKDIPSLIFWLKSVPLPEKLDITIHENILRNFIDNNTTPRGIKTIENRLLIVIKKN